MKSTLSTHERADVTGRDSNDGSDTEKAQHVRDARETLDLSRHKNDDLVAEGCSAEQNRDHATNATLPEENSREKTTDEGPSMVSYANFHSFVITNTC